MTGPSMWRRWAPAATMALLLTAGCADESGTAPRSADGSAPTAGGSSATAPVPPQRTDPATVAVLVRLVVSGGIAGVHETYEVSRDDPPAGMPPAKVDRVLALAGDPSLRGLVSERFGGAAPCCDLRVYDVTVRYADGTRTRVRTAQTLEAPRELERLIAVLSR